MGRARAARILRKRRTALAGAPPQVRFWMRFLMGSESGPIFGGSFRPIGGRNAATFDDRLHGAQRQNPAAMIGHDDLFPGRRVAPFLVAS
jgi:hypothetical protein